jgi:hypothetical protein
MRRLFPILFMLSLGLSLPFRSNAAENSFIKDATDELSVLSGYGVTPSGFGDIRNHLQTFDAILRYGHFLSPEVGDGWYRARHEVLLEIPVNLAVDRNGRAMTGGNILGCWKFTSLREYLPYLFAGGGIFYVDLGMPGMGSRLDFSYQGGVGIQYFITRETALNLEYRYQHVSNANIASPNEGLNASRIHLGITAYR